jgi:hypothetical protein
MLAMRRESDNLNNSSNNTPHSYTASNLSGDNNLTHLNYPHPVHSYSTSSAGYSGYQSSKHYKNPSQLEILMKKIFKGNRSNPALISSSSSSQNQLEEYVDILQVQQLLLENSTASTSSSSTVNTVSYSSPASTSASTTPSSSKNIQSRPRVNLQKAAEFGQVQGKLKLFLRKYSREYD